MGKYLSIIMKIISAPYDLVWQGLDYKRISKLHAEQLHKIRKLYGEVGRLAQRAKNLSESCEYLKVQSEKLTQERDSISKKYEEQTAINSELKITVDGLTNRLVNITQENEGLKKEKDSLETRITEYKESIRNSPEYKISEEARQKAEEKRDEYKKQSEERDKLIDLLKAEKTNLIKSTSSLLREKAIGTLIEYFKKNFPKQPYVFIDPATAKIIDYTDEFGKELGVNGNLKGQSYLTILNGKENIDRIRHIKKFLSVEEEKEFNVEYVKSGEKIPLHITKKPPISVDLPPDIKSIYKNDIETIACVPLLVEKVSKWKKTLQYLPYFHGRSLDEIIAETEKVEEFLEEVRKNSPKIHRKLINLHGWSADEILEKEKKVGEMKAYIDFRDYLSKEKRKGARIRLKEIKAEREKREEKRDKIINAFWKKYSVKKEDMMKTWNESKNFKDFIYRCREISKPHRIKQEPQETEKTEKST